ncbi:MAG: Uma2 family endonuclease [Anaerolineae bacterium]|nr:Uma2 family endonuclease [Anaerolineae bacterium]
MAALPRSQITPERYLAMDRQAATKNEYLDGEIVAMAGASLVHNLIVANVVGELRQQLRARPCRVYPSDVRVLIPTSGNYVYPDASVVCGEPKVADVHFDILLNPTLVVEVLSGATEAADRGKKFEGYRKLPSLQEYLLIAQDTARLERYVRQASGDWLLTEFNHLDDIVRLMSVECDLALAEVYNKVDFVEQNDAS